MHFKTIIALIILYFSLRMEFSELYFTHRKLRLKRAVLSQLKLKAHGNF